MGAILFAVPIGIASAIYISELASPKLADLLKPFIEIPGRHSFRRIRILRACYPGTALQNTFSLPTGQTALTGSIMLGIMALPTIISISEDAISSVPSSLKDGYLPLGPRGGKPYIKL